ncbi:MAG: histidine phosphatase family protein [Egibacteraceae bacterium]
MTARLLLVRHGESEWNAASRLQGHGGTGLSALGKEEAAATATHLVRSASAARLLVRSDLPRVVETAAPTEAALDVEIRVDERLREIDVGSWSGLTWDEVAAADPATLVAWQAGQDVRRGGGETFAELRSRVWSALRDLAEVDGPVLVFTHGGPIRVGVAAALELPPLGERALAPVANCSISELVLHGDVAVLAAYNRSDHVDGLRGARLTLLGGGEDRLPSG